MAAISISVRVDVFSMLYAVLLGIMLLISRRANARVWPLYTILLVILLPVQFLSVLGLPLFLCQGKTAHGRLTTKVFYVLIDIEADRTLLQLTLDILIHCSSCIIKLRGENRRKKTI